MKLVKSLLVNFPIWQILLHVLTLSLVYSILLYFNIFNSCPHNSNLVQWDSGWYKSIVDSGYNYVPGQQSNLAFFPLFPYLWKALSASALAISLFNFFITMTSFALLFKYFKLESKYFFVLMSTPSLFFCFVPYTEALFFLFSTLMFIGFEVKKYWLSYIGLFLACLTRSVSMLIFPIILFSFFLQLNFNRENNRKQITQALMLIAISVLSLVVVFYVQYAQTGVLFEMFGLQKYWGRELGLPKFYLTTWGGFELLWLDGLGLFVGVSAIGIALSMFIHKLKNFDKVPSLSFSFSVGYLAVITAIAFFYSPVDAYGNTSLMSHNRYIFATIYFFLFISHYLKKGTINWRSTCFFYTILLFVLVITGGLSDFTLTHFEYLLILVLYSSSYFLLANEKYNDYILIGLYLLNVTVQLFLLNSFINGNWIG
ncbi:MAG TPA: hypothetical protein VIK89_11900 [Cytophagaceae bacterium]